LKNISMINLKRLRSNLLKPPSVLNSLSQKRDK